MTVGIGSSDALSLRGVSSGYGRSTVLRDVDLDVAAGTVTALLGPNGAGKTTILRTASGLLRPSKGSVLIDGVDVTDSSPSSRAANGMCHIPEGRAIFPSLTVRENLRLLVRRRGDQDVYQRAVEAFPALGKRMSQTAGSMSGGEQQMLALARAFVQDPRLVLVDEASLGLAPLVVDDIFDFLERLKARGASLLVVDQFVVRALALADHVYVVSNGQLVFDGTPESLQGSDLFERYLGSEVAAP
jgi:branched-chain amino acid transport system ATP-binding protein